MFRGLPASQSGAALLALILVIITGSAWLLMHNLNATAIQNQRDEHDARILATAKQALIDYAITHSDLNTSGEHGFLPCPDTNEANNGTIPEGGSDGVCGSRYENVLGRFPWRTLGLEPLKDSSGECLWYAVSGQYKYSGSSSTEMLNEDTNGTFEIYSNSDGSLIQGATPDSYPVAVIFAPGEPVENQDRASPYPGLVSNCGGNYTKSNYLDSNTVGAAGTVDNSQVEGVAEIGSTKIIDRLMSGTGTDKTEFNDKAVYITNQDIWDALRERNDFPRDDGLESNGDLDKNTFYDRNDSFSNDAAYDDIDINNFMKWVAACIAQYGNLNSSSNKSLVYPAPLNIDDETGVDDYRDDSAYTDLGGGYIEGVNVSTQDGVILFGRLPDTINISDSINQKGRDRLIAECDLTNDTVYNSSGDTPYRIDTGSSAEDTAIQEKYKRMWSHWKDHILYAVSDVFQPRPTIEWDANTCLPFGFNNCVCGNGARCLRLTDRDNNQMDDVAAIVIFSGSPIGGQSRYAPPVDVGSDSNDTKKLITDYLEDTSSIADTDNIASLGNYENRGLLPDNPRFVNIVPMPDITNDVVYCINDNDYSTYFEVGYCDVSD